MAFFDVAVDRFLKTNVLTRQELVELVDMTRRMSYDMAVHAQGIIEKELEKVGFDSLSREEQSLVLGLLRNDHRIKTVWQTGLQTVYNLSKRRGYMLNPSVDLLRYDAVNDNRTRPEHRKLDNFIAPKNHPIWNTIYPPNGYNCRCTVKAISYKDAEQQYGWTPDKASYAIPDGSVDVGFDWAPSTYDEYAQFLRDWTMKKYAHLVDRLTRLAFERYDNIRQWAESYVASRWPNYRDYTPDELAREAGLPSTLSADTRMVREIGELDGLDAMSLTVLTIGAAAMNDELEENPNGF